MNSKLCIMNVAFFMVRTRQTLIMVLQGSQLCLPQQEGSLPKTTSFCLYWQSNENKHTNELKLRLRFFV